MLTGRMSVLILESEGCSMHPVTLILPFTDRASSGFSVLIPTRPCNDATEFVNIVGIKLKYIILLNARMNV